MDRASTLKVTMDVLTHHIRPPFEIIVVDNGSTEPAAITLLSELESTKRAKVIRNPINLGLSKATNQGLGAAQYECVIHMDNDCVIQYPGWNQALASYLEKYPEVGIVAPDLDQNVFIQRKGYKEVMWFLGMVWAVRKRIFNEIGGYDEQLLHQQEADFCLRIRMHGYRAALCLEIGSGSVAHNDPGGPPSELAQARAHIGTIQFRDKWAVYFRGRAWSYSTVPLYLMQDYPINQEFLRQLALPLELNDNNNPEKVRLVGQEWIAVKSIRPDMAYTEPDVRQPAYEEDKRKAIEKWHNLAGEGYAGYRWPANLIRPAD